MPGDRTHDEISSVRERYARRTELDGRYSLLNVAALLAVQERQRALARLFAALGWKNLNDVRLIEVGCGDGSNLLEFLRLGFLPEHLQGIELLAERAERARLLLPSSVRLAEGDASSMEEIVLPASQDVVYQATVFSSLLDDAFQRKLARVMWSWVRPGGGILWYDFTVDNPSNPDVRGVRVARIRELFPEGRLRIERLTLAPPIARRVVRLHPALYGALNSLPWLRTHALAWIAR